MRRLVDWYDTFIESKAGMITGWIYLALLIIAFIMQLTMSLATPP